MKGDVDEFSGTLYERILKAEGTTPSERYLASMCARTFLSLWSYPRPHRDQAGGKEICDLLAAFGNNVVLFSDKHCELKPRKGLTLDWSRWLRGAVIEGAKQVWGAERWLKAHPTRVFLDAECKRPFPMDLSAPDVRFHLVVSVHGVASACRAMLGGSGSLMLRSDVRGIARHIQPFVIGDLDPDRTFVHVFDDTSLDIVMQTVDTVSDFLSYLRAKAELFHSSRVVAAAGEEEFLAWYLTHLDEAGNHAFILPKSHFVGIDEGHWAEFSASPERKAQMEHDEVSYLWDRLIDRFARHALEGSQYFATEPAFQSSEIVLRLMASESRLRRRFLARALLERLETTPPDHRGLRVIPLSAPGETMYVFLILPWAADRPDDENREVRRELLTACVLVAKHKNPEAQDIVGIATETDLGRDRRTEDALYLDGRDWTAEDDANAKQLSEDLEILVTPTRFVRHVDEYPATFGNGALRVPLPKNPRNQLCPCGSGKKYKRCHARRLSV